MGTTEFINILKEYGPFTVPLCAAQAYAIHWMKRQADKMEQRAIAAEQDAKNLRDKRLQDRSERADELLEATKAMGQLSEGMAKRLREHDERIDLALKRGKIGG